MELAGMCAYHADREACERKHDLVALAVLAAHAAALQVLSLEELRGLGAETLDGALATRLPVLALHQHDEIVAADVAEEIPARVHRTRKNGGGKLDHVVAAPVAVRVVEGLEVVDVAV